MRAMRKPRCKGVGMIAFGLGLILARVLPVWALLLMSGVILICAGCRRLKGS